MPNKLGIKFRKRNRRMTAYYESILFKITCVARIYNYAIGFHGSGKRDLDLIAVPWCEDCIDADTFVKELLENLNGWMSTYEKYPVLKPHGRKAYSFFIPNKPGYGCRGYVDLSVMPTKGKQ